MTTWIDIAGWTLVHFLWQGALVAAVTWAALRALRPATARYALACTALATMLAAPLATAWVIARGATVPPVTVRHAATGPLAGGAALIPTASSALPPTMPAASAPPASVASVDLARLMPLVVTMWLSGVAMLLARLAGGCWRIRRLHRAAFAEPVSHWQGAADSLARRLHLARPVFVVDSMRVDTPTVIGWLRPIVLLPVAAMTNLAPSQVEAILAHELAHIRRHDFLVNVLQTISGRPGHRSDRASARCTVRAPWLALGSAAVLFVPLATGILAIRPVRSTTGRSGASGVWRMSSMNSASATRSARMPNRAAGGAQAPSSPSFDVVSIRRAAGGPMTSAPLPAAIWGHADPLARFGVSTGYV